MTDPDDINVESYVKGLSPCPYLEWNALPSPPGIGFQTHKFTILDAVARCSAKIRTDPGQEYEELIVGFQAARVLATLPHFMAQHPNKSRLLPKEGQYTLLGEIGSRRVYLATETFMDYYIRLENRQSIAWIKIINLEE